MSASRIPGIIADIELGKKSLEIVSERQQEVMDAESSEATFFLTSAGGVVIHDFYNTVEKTFRQIAEEIDGGVPGGVAWHQQLLQRMTIIISERRPAVIDEALARSLNEFLRFRHLFRHIYGFELEWERIRPLLEDLPKVKGEFIRQIDGFIAFLQTLNAD